MSVIALGLGSLQIGSGLSISGTTLSVATSGSITIAGLGNGTVQLINDSTSPGNSYFYGTDGAGSKGWYVTTSIGITALTGDVTASGTGSVVTTLATVNSNVGTFAGLTINGKGLVTAASNLTITTTAPLTGGGVLGNLTLAMPAATGSVDGYLTSTDWTTFNSKQSAESLRPLATSNTYLRDWRRGLQRLIAGTNTPVKVMVLGDSWSSLSTTYLNQLDPDTKRLLGDAGAGWISFVSGSTPANPTNATISQSGTWTDVTFTGRGINRLESSSSSVSATKTITLVTGQQASSPVLHYLVKSGGGILQYRFNAGSWTTVNTSGSADTYSTVALSGAPAGAWVLDVQVNTASTDGITIFGVDLADSNAGIRWHALAFPGYLTGTFSGANAALWQAGISAISPTVVEILLGTNDQANSITLAQYGTNLTTIISNLRTAMPGVDILVVSPPENLSTGHVLTMADYRDQARTVASANNCGFLDLVQEFGPNTSAYDSSSPRILFATGDPLHPTNLGYSQISEAIRSVLLSDASSGLTFGNVSQGPSAASTANRYLQTNASTQASTTLLNPGLIVYPNGWGIDLGYNSSRPNGYKYRTRLFGSSISGEVAISITPTLTPASQSDFTDVMVANLNGVYALPTTEVTDSTGLTGGLATAGGLGVAKTAMIGLGVRSNTAGALSTTNTNPGVYVYSNIYGMDLGYSALRSKYNTRFITNTGNSSEFSFGTLSTNALQSDFTEWAYLAANGFRSKKDLRANDAGVASSTNTNPGVYVYQNTYGLDLGYSRGHFTTRVITDTSNSSDISFGGLASNTLQSNYTEWGYVTSAGFSTAGTYVAGTPILPASGGTGQSTYTNGQLLIGNTTGNTLTKATLTGTANQVIVTNGTGSITLSTPQDIGTASSPTFGGLILTGGLGLGVTSTATAGGTTILLGTSTSIQIFTGSANQSVTLPAANIYASASGAVYIIKNRSTGIITIQGAGTNTIDGSATYNLSLNDSIILVSDGSANWNCV